MNLYKSSAVVEWVMTSVILLIVMGLSNSLLMFWGLESYIANPVICSIITLGFWLVDEKFRPCWEGARE